MSQTSLVRLTDAEWTVMNAVWDDAPASARDVLERIEVETEWAYSTVKTILTRLVGKGALRVRMRANTGLYEPRITRSEARRSAVHSLLDRAFDGAFGSLLQHLISEERLSRKDRAKLVSMLNELDGTRGRSR
jgi:BlaI family penicillinase repressor